MLGLLAFFMIAFLGTGNQLNSGAVKIIGPSDVRLPKNNFRKNLFLQVRFRDPQLWPYPEEELSLIVSEGDNPRWREKQIASKNFYTSYGLFELEAADLTGNGIEEFLLVTGDGRGTNVRRETLRVFTIYRNSLKEILRTKFGGYFGVDYWRYHIEYADVNEDGILDLELILDDIDYNRAKLSLGNDFTIIPHEKIERFCWDKLSQKLKGC